MMFNGVERGWLAFTDLRIRRISFILRTLLSIDKNLANFSDVAKNPASNLECKLLKVT